MARPSRCRRICLEPEYDTFVPYGVNEYERVVLTVDEYEAIRLIDYEKRTHEQCARQMGISRTTVTEMYERARTKVSDCIVNGKALHISGGNYRLCDGSAWQCCGKNCGRANAAPPRPPVVRERSAIARIAVPCANGAVFPHFGRAQQFWLYTVEQGQVAGKQTIDTEGSGHRALAGVLAAQQVDTVICGGIGVGAQTALAEAGIQLYSGVSGDADDAVQALLSDTLECNPEASCHQDPSENK
ncbi:MAG: DUF134 domain-containing protein [Butyricicoccus sp.]